MSNFDKKSVDSRKNGTTTGNRTVLLPLVGAVGMPVVIGFLEPGIIDLIWELFFWAAFWSVPIVLFGIVYTWSR